MNMKKLKFIVNQTLAWCLIIGLVFMMLPLSAKASEELYVERKADVVFVIDATGSMGGCISSVKSNITDFINLISKEDVDIRVKFVIYRDITEAEATTASDWYSFTDSSASYLTDVDATGGGDGPETLLDGIGKMVSGGFRSDAVKYCVAFTDAETKLDNNYGYATEDDAIAAINAAGINMSMVADSDMFDDYTKYVSTDKGGILADIYGDYSILLKGLAITIIDELDGLCTLTMEPRYCKEGEDITVRVTSSAEGGISYAEDFTVLFDGEAVEVISKETTYFEFKVPTTKILGKYEVKTVNNGVTNLIGHFTIESAAEYGTMTPASTTTGTAVTVKVPVTKMNYASDFKVMLGGKKVTVTSKTPEYFEFTVTQYVSPNSYDVTILNGGMQEYIGDFVVNAKTPVIGSLNPNCVEEGNSVTVKVSATDLTYDSTFSVMIGDTTALNVKMYSNKFSFKVPDTLEPGIYNVTAINGSSSYSLGTFEVIAKVVTPPTLSAMSVTTTEEGTAQIVKVYFSDMTYGTDFTVNFNGTTATGIGMYSDYFKFKVPDTTAAGTYTVEMVNEGIYYSLGEFTVTPKAVPVPTLSAMDVTTTEEGTAQTVKVYFSDMTYGTDFTVNFNGTTAAGIGMYSDYFKFKVPDTTAAGTYTVEMVNEGTTYSLGEFTVTPKAVLVPTLSAMDVTTTEEGTAQTVKVYFSDMTYGTDFTVNFNGTTAEGIGMYSNYFKFKVPNTVVAGTYTVEMVNEGTTYSLGEFTVTPKAVPVPTLSAMDVTTTEEGTAQTVKVYFSDMTYGTDFTVNFNGTTAAGIGVYSDYFKFKVPDTTAAGTYTVEMVNEGTIYSLGEFTVTPKAVPVPTLSAMDVTTTEEGTAQTVKVYFSDMSYGADFTVLFNGTTADGIGMYGDYFKFKVPNTVVAGTYTVEMVNEGTTYNLGEFIVTEKIVPIPEFTEVNPTAITAGSTSYVKVYFNNFTYGSDFNVQIADSNALSIKRYSNYFKFKIPTSIAAGTYEITVINSGNTYSAGTITIN